MGLLLLWSAAKRSGRGNEALILLVALLGFVSAQTMNTMAWQRYFEPIVLIVLAWLGALVCGRRRRRTLRTCSGG